MKKMLGILAAFLCAAHVEATSPRALPVAHCAPAVHYGRAVNYGGHYDYSQAFYAKYPFGSVAYNSGGELAEVTKDLVSLVKDLLKENRELRGSGGGPLAVREDPPHFQVAKNTCFQCHNPSDAAKKGGDFVLFDAGGRLKNLDPSERGKVILRVSAGEMPPRKEALNDGDRLKLISGMTRAPETTARAPELREAPPMRDAKD